MDGNVNGVTMASRAVKTVVFIGSWAILLAGILVAVTDAMSGSIGNWAVFLPIWGVVTAMVTYSAVDDLRKRRKPSSPQS